MKAETRVSYGLVPHTLNGTPLSDATWQMEGDEFLLRAEGEHYFHYRKGFAVTIERGDGAAIAEERLWLDGSVYSAIASLNGLLPVHASAVVLEDSVFAFAGPTGAGKSTLAAALGSYGLPMFCDDTLILDLSKPNAIACLPGHKRLKLTPQSIRLTGSTGGERVSPTVDKVYADPPAGVVQSPLPLAAIIFLEEGPAIDIRRLTGPERLLSLQDDHYTTNLFARAQGFDRESYFRHLVHVSNRVEMVRLTRPRDERQFDEGVAAALSYLNQSGRTVGATHDRDQEV